jgi:hypothetical protein
MAEGLGCGRSIAVSSVICNGDRPGRRRPRQQPDAR